MSKFLKIALPVFWLLLIAFGFYAHAENGSTGKPSQNIAIVVPPDRQTAAYRASFLALDSTVNNAAMLAAVPEFTVGGRPNIKISGRFSIASASCVVRIVYSWHDLLAGTETVTDESGAITLTADGTETDATGLFIAPTKSYDSLGAYSVRIKLVSITGGTVAFWVGSW